MSEFVTHAFAPVFDQKSRVLVLGTMPSPASRENGFYYSHPRNRFWPVLAALLGEQLPVTAAEKRALALSHGIALWDVLASCRIDGAADHSIREPVPNDLGPLLRSAPIGAIFCTGNAAAALYRKHCQPLTGMPAVTLPSTSPANARWTLEALTEAYRPLLWALS